LPKFLTWTDDNLLRQVVYEGLREHKPAAEVRLPVQEAQMREPEMVCSEPASFRLAAGSHETPAGGRWIRTLAPPREEEPTRRDGFIRPARISLSRETEGSKTVSSSGPASAAVFGGPRLCRELKVNFAFRAPSRRVFTIEAVLSIRRDQLDLGPKRYVGGNE
jgi:hypothetical protein